MSEPWPRTECGTLCIQRIPNPNMAKPCWPRGPQCTPCLPTCGKPRRKRAAYFSIGLAAGPGPGGAKSRSRVKLGGGWESEILGAEAKDARIQRPKRIGRNQRREAGQTRSGREGAALQSPVFSWCLDTPLNAQDPCHWHLPAFVRAATTPTPAPPLSQAHRAHALDSAPLYSYLGTGQQARLTSCQAHNGLEIPR